MATKSKDDHCVRILSWALLVLLAIVVCTVVNIRNYLLLSQNDNKELPTIEITLANNVTLEDINNGDKLIRYEDNQLFLTNDNYQQIFDNVEIRGRGNTSWMNEKKPYRVKFANKVDLLGMGKFKKWAFLTYALDDSLLRGDIGFYLAKIIDEKYPLKGEFVNVYIGDKDLGLYYVTPTIDIDKKIVDLRDEMGILVEADGAWYDENHFLKTKMNNYLEAKESVIEENLDIGLNSFKDSFELFEESVMENDYEKIKQVIEIDSLEDYFLLSEFTQNYDAYYSSWYFYKDGLADKIHVGPAWDFDGILGNKNWRESRTESSTYPDVVFTEWRPEYLSVDKNGCAGDGRETILDRPNNGLRYMLCKLILIPEFRESVGKKYLDKLSNKKEEILNYVRKRADYIREAAIRNNEIWNRGSFDEEVDYLIWWLDKRFDCFNEMYSEEKTF